jgi:hypothetical protein
VIPHRLHETRHVDSLAQVLANCCYGHSRAKFLNLHAKTSGWRPGASGEAQNERGPPDGGPRVLLFALSANARPRPMRAVIIAREQTDTEHAVFHTGPPENWQAGRSSRRCLSLNFGFRMFEAVADFRCLWEGRRGANRMETIGSLRSRTYGSFGRSVIVLHGGPAAVGSAVEIAKGLSDRFRVFEPWQRGSGVEPLTVTTMLRTCTP